MGGVSAERAPDHAASRELPSLHLEEGSLRLRPWTPGDLPSLRAAGADPLVTRFRYSIPRSAPEARRWLERTASDRREGQRLELAVLEHGSAEPLGSVSLKEFAHGRALVGYWLLPEARGRGLATRAVRLLANWALRELGLARLWMHVEPENLASERVAARCGFTYEGRLRSHWESHDGRRQDTLIYGLLAHEAPGSVGSPMASVRRVGRGG
jgi:RimJ/RimL family protein N-acetyltransferase